MNKPRKAEPKPDYSRTPTLAELTIAVTELQADKSSLYAKLAAAEAKIERLTWAKVHTHDARGYVWMCRHCDAAHSEGALAEHAPGCIAEEK